MKLKKNLITIPSSLSTKCLNKKIKKKEACKARPKVKLCRQISPMQNSTWLI